MNTKSNPRPCIRVVSHKSSRPFKFKHKEIVNWCNARGRGCKVSGHGHLVATVNVSIRQHLRHEALGQPLIGIQREILKHATVRYHPGRLSQSTWLKGCISLILNLKYKLTTARMEELRKRGACSPCG